MKTAIQELFSKLEIEHPNLFNTNTLDGREFINSYYKFFELEKKQIIDCWNKRSKIEGVLTFTDNRTGEQYYNETFKK
jgi:hypothetical protein